MRELKFRAWDGKLKVMMMPDYCDWEDFMIEPDGTVYRTYETGIYYSYRNKDVVDYLLMQYTGLKDKNGKDIYEGDITKAGDLICEIKWGKSQWVAKWKQKRLDMYCEPSIEFRKHEVIGNIYENPELLNGD